MSSVDLASPDKRHIQEFFDAIASRYDFLNGLLSFHLDEFWRRRSKPLILEGHEKKILDLGVGTGKYLNLFLKKYSWEHAAGLDFSREMLNRAKAELPPEVQLVEADFHDMPFENEKFDLIISAFALRSVKDMDRFLSEVYRILQYGGKAAFLCLTRPRSRFWRMFYYPYLKYYLPLMGRLISGNPKAYTFLSESIQHFQEPEKTLSMMMRQGFKTVRSHSFTFGAATLIIGRK